MRYFRQLVMFALLTVLATACTKEEVVTPTGSQAAVTGALKNTTGGEIGTTGAPPSCNLGSGTPDTGNTGQDGDISDDGDDISDSEKKRKKRR